jgi:hypothetical protein
MQTNRLFFVLFFFAFCTTIRAQQINQNGDGRIVAVLSPEYTYKWFSIPDSHPAKAALINLNKKLKPQLGYRIGMGYDRLLNDKTRLGIGVYLSKLGYRYKVDTLKWGIQNNGNGGFDPTIPSGESISAFTLHYNYFFLNVPLSVRYYWKQQGKMSLYATGIFSPHILLKGNSLLSRLGSVAASNGPTTINRINFALGGGLGLEYNITPNSSLSLQPTFQYHLSPTVKAAVQEHLWEIGTQIGCHFRL